MLRVILGTVALGSVGYGIKKCLTDEDCIDNLKDKIQDVAMKGFEGIETLEEKMGLNEYRFFTEEDSSNTQDTKTTSTEASEQERYPMLTTLFKYKKMVVSELEDSYSFALCKMDEVKKDKLKGDFELTKQMSTNIEQYQHLLKSFYAKVDEQLKVNSPEDEELLSDLLILKKLCTTKIIKKGEINPESTELILDATRRLLGLEDMIHVDLSS